MKNENTDKTEFDKTDEAIAAVFGDVSAWPVPPAGFRERCAARVEELVLENRARRARWAFAGVQWTRVAAVLVVMLCFAAVVLRPQGDETAASAATEPQGALVAQSADGLYEEVEEVCEEAPMPGGGAHLADVAKKMLPRTPATKVFGSLCMASVKAAGLS